MQSTAKRNETYRSVIYLFFLHRNEPKTARNTPSRIAPTVEQFHTEPGAQYNLLYNEIYRNAQHLLIGGATGAGKSVLLNGLITTAITVNSPAKVNFILIDPKRVELKQYKKLPHVLMHANNAETIAHALTVAARIMENRLEEMDRNDAKSYGGEKLIIVIDELGDLLNNKNLTLEQSRQIVGSLRHIMQLGRAARVFVWGATQSPSRKTIPPELQLNFTDCIALRCRSAIESRQVIGINGAEKLPQYGKGLFLTPSMVNVSDIDIPYLSDEFIEARCAWWYTAASRTIKGTA